MLLKLLIDDRHTDIDVLDREPIKTRAFGAWAMISPKVTPTGQRQLTALLADDLRSMLRYRDTMLDLCADQMSGVSTPR
uniref:BLUF domain-containing protein n=1 Tax=viral metagenome TaxID=1070528 RepID=A0A6H1ZJC8_9ZZZZ